MADYERPILAAEEKFFNQCNAGNGRLPHDECYCYDSDDCWGVPVIAVLTKADALKLPALNQLMREGLAMREAKPRVGEFAAEMLRKLKARIESQLNGCKYPPKAYLSMASEL